MAGSGSIFEIEPVPNGSIAIDVRPLARSGKPLAVGMVGRARLSPEPIGLMWDDRQAIAQGTNVTDGPTQPRHAGRQ